ncbi:DUF2076 domain-containing protein [Ensifer soli]|uniref:DUF2076 domain-containing protein n=1 Tax=Ciceribacter sp. sgz301302 TaxID=3342379 RepID=UPI0035B77FBB
MSPEERQLLTRLFDRVHAATAAPRDREADALIADAVRADPAAPYYLAQAVIVQDKGLEAAAAEIARLEARIRDLESAGNSPRPLAEDGGFLSSLFGTRQGAGGAGADPAGRPGPWEHAERPAPSRPQGFAERPAPISSVPNAGSAGGFLRGAMTTAAGVAGGMLLANTLGGFFHGPSSGLFGSGLPTGLPVEETVINTYYDGRMPAGSEAGAWQAVDDTDADGSIFDGTPDDGGTDA